MKGNKTQETPDDAFPAYVDSLKQAVAELEARGYPCDIPHLQRAKVELRSPIFKGTRVHFKKDLFDWLEENEFEEPPPEPSDDEDTLESKEVLERRKLREQYLTARKRRLILDSEFTANAELERQGMAIGAATRSALEGLRGDVPKLEGLSAAELDQWLAEKIDAICSELQDEASNLYS